MVEMKVWAVVGLGDEVANHKELIASLEEKSGVPEHVSIADWDNIRLLGIVDSKTGAMHWNSGRVQPNFRKEMCEYTEKLEKEKGSKWKHR